MNSSPKDPFFTDDKRIIELLDKAVGLSESGEYQEAVDVYKSILLFEPENGIAQIGKAYAEMEVARRTADYHGTMDGYSNYFYTVDSCLKKRAECGVDDEYVTFALRFINTCEDKAMHVVEIYRDTLIDTEKLWRQDCAELRAAGWPYSMTEQDKSEMDSDILPILTKDAMILKEVLCLSNRTVDNFVTSLIAPDKIGVKIKDELEKLRKNNIAKKEPINGRAIQRCFDLVKPFLSSRAHKEVHDAISKIDELDAEFYITVNKIDALIKAFDDIAREKYWAEHAEEKAALEAKKAELKQSIEDKRKDNEARKAEVAEQIKAKENEIEKAEASAHDALIAARAKVSDLEKEKASIGFFKFKEKKTVKTKIAEAAANVEQVRRLGRKTVDEVNSQKEELENKIRAFDADFTSQKMSIEEQIAFIDREFSKNR